MNWEEASARFFFACLLGAMVGFERQWHQRTAGLRTNILVSIGAAAFTIFGATYLDGQSVPRIVAQVVSGIGFLGAGAIMRDGFTVQGINTAATIWCSAGLGTFCGAGYHREALIFSFFIIATNTLLRGLENYMVQFPSKNGEYNSIYVVEAQCDKRNEEHVRRVFIEHLKLKHLTIKQIEVKLHDDKHITLRAIVKVKSAKELSIQHLVEEMALDQYVTASKWNHLAEASR